MTRFALLLTPLLLALAGCGSSSSSSSSPASASSTSSAAPAPSSSAAAAPSSGAPAGQIIHAKMANFAFAPKVIHARVGDQIQWVNEDSAPHNVAGTSGPSFPASPTLSQGGKFTLKLTRPGTYQYICTIHPFMKATLVVGR